MKSFKLLNSKAKETNDNNAKFRFGKLLLGYALWVFMKVTNDFENSASRANLETWDTQ